MAILLMMVGGCGAAAAFGLLARGYVRDKPVAVTEAPLAE